VKWIYLTHPQIEGAVQWASDEPGVVERQEALGWVRTDEPHERPFVPDGAPIEPDDEFVTLVNHETGASHPFPNNPDALAGAQDAGWSAPIPDPEPESETADESADETKEG
jgi:hypothetical protein